MKKAFTLAEVLITLGIIGVVAALTLPNIVGYYKRKESSVRIKKFYSIMEQAIRLSEIDNAEVMYWEKESMDTDDPDFGTNNPKKTLKYFLSYIEPYLKYTSYDTKGEYIGDGNEPSELRIKMADGSLVYLFNGSCIDMVLDVNGKKAPNKWGYDLFDFLLCKDSAQKSNCGGSKHWCTYGPAQYKNREEALAKCKIKPQTCSVLLQYDNWEFKEDYPYKL